MMLINKKMKWAALIVAVMALDGCRFFRRAPGPLMTVSTLAGHTDAAQLRDPFGVATDKNGAVYVADGDTGQIWQFDAKGAGRVVAQNLKTPSGLAVTQDGALIVAETGAHVVRRISLPDGAATIIAGQPDQAGDSDGAGPAARFNGPVGIAIAADQTIYVADTYNDRIRAIDAQGQVRTIAGRTMGYADGDAATARFATPCGIAVRPDGVLLVADTGNHRLRLVSPIGQVSTWAGKDEPGQTDGTLAEAAFDEPTALALDESGAVYVADAGSSSVRRIAPAADATVVANNQPAPYNVITLTGQGGRGLADGALAEARFSRPSGVAVTDGGALIVADTGNRLVRAVNRQGAAVAGAALTQEQARALRPKAEDFRKLAPPRWPYAPPERPREIAATFGELRGEVNKPDDGVWFHNGLDIPGGYGEIVRAVRSEKILLPLAVGLLDTKREYIRFPTMGYVHLRIGRDAAGKPFDDPRFILAHDEKNKISAVRVRRGTQFQAGDALGTLNSYNHVHLIAGPTGGEMNALAALELPGIADTKPPFIEGVDLYDQNWQPFAATAKGGPVNVMGAVRIVVRAYDQMDGNAARRRLGLYRLGYQILQADGNTPAPGWETPRATISFETLPDDVRAAPLAYAPGSLCGYTPVTVLGYTVTNHVRDREAREDFWQTAQLAAGDYLVRVNGEDFFGNRTTQDVKVRIGAGATR